MKKLKSWGYATVKTPVPACDGQTDGFTIANTALSIASYADAL